MTFQISSILGVLVLLAVTQAADPACEDLTKPQDLEHDFSSIMGKWVFSEGIANHDTFTNALLTVNSAWLEFSPNPLNHTVTVKNGFMVKGKCDIISLNMTIKHHKISASVSDTQSEADLLPTCFHCRTLHYTIQMKNETIKALYLYTRAHKLSKSDMDLFWKQAECLGFSKERQFSYDGVTELCEEDKKGPPTEHTEPEEKKEE